MQGGSGILARNNFAGRANPSRIFAGQARGGPMRGGLARFAIPICDRNSHQIQMEAKTLVVKPLATEL